VAQEQCLDTNMATWAVMYVSVMCYHSGLSVC